MIITYFCTIIKTMQVALEEESAQEGDVPELLSKNMHIVSPQESGSLVYTPQKIVGDYELYCARRKDFKPDRELKELQRDLIRLYETGEVDEFIQAMEWARARARREWTLDDINAAIWYIDQSRQNSRLPQVAVADAAQIAQIHYEWKLAHMR